MPPSFKNSGKAKFYSAVAAAAEEEAKYSNHTAKLHTNNTDTGGIECFNYQITKALSDSVCKF